MNDVRGHSLNDDNGASDASVSQTGFDITKTAGSIPLYGDLKNMNPLSSGKRDKRKQSKIISYVIIVVLSIVAIILGYQVMNSLF